MITVTDTQCMYCGNWDYHDTMLIDNGTGERYCSQRCHTISCYGRAESEALHEAYLALLERTRVQAVARGWRAEYDCDGDECGYFVCDETGVCLPCFDYETFEDEDHAWRVACEYAIDEEIFG